MPAAGSPSRTATTFWSAPSSKRQAIRTIQEGRPIGPALRFLSWVRTLLTLRQGRSSPRTSMVLMALLASLDVLLVGAAARAARVLLAGAGGRSVPRIVVIHVLVALLASLHMLLVGSTLVCHWIISFGCIRGQERPRVANRWRRKAFRILTFRDDGGLRPALHTGPSLGFRAFDALETIHRIVSSATPNASHPFPIRMPAPSTSEPPRTTWKAARRNGVSIYLFWMKAMAQSSKKTTTAAVIVAVQKCGMR